MNHHCLDFMISMDIVFHHKHVLCALFYDALNTVASISNDDPPHSFWNEIDIDGFMHTIHLDNESTITFSDEWLAPKEREENECA